jgi:hypothetical protein
MALQQFRRPKNASRVLVQFTLPGMETKIECAGEFAWENAGRQSGVRFVDISTQTREQLNAWLQQHSPEMETDDPPVACKLSDLSLGGCYLEMASPFPVRTRLVLAMKVGQVEKFIHALMNSNGALPELMVKPEGMDNSDGPLSVSQVSDDVDDPLLDLFRIKSELTTDEFQLELRKQRGSHSSADATVPA